MVTMYHPVRHQTDRTPNILADGTKITIHKASEYKYVRVSRNLLKRWGGWLDYGDFIVLSGTDGKGRSVSSQRYNEQTICKSY